MTTQPSNAALLPCPFCGDTEDSRYKPYLDADDSSRVECLICGGKTSLYDTPTEAIAAWNRRARELDAEQSEHIHTCSYYCTRPACVLAQRDQMREELEGRELDAAKGGEEVSNSAIRNFRTTDTDTPPTQPGDAVERVARAIAATDSVPFMPPWSELHPDTISEYIEMARAAIAAMPASGEGVDAVPVVVCDAPDAHRVQFRVGVQQFHIGPDYFDTKEEATAFASMFRAAIAGMTASGEDTARLDWLDSQGFAYGFEDMHEGNRWSIEGAFDNLHAAIDAARGARHAD